MDTVDCEVARGIQHRDSIDGEGLEGPIFRGDQSRVWIDGGTGFRQSDRNGTTAVSLEDQTQIRYAAIGRRGHIVACVRRQRRPDKRGDFRHIVQTVIEDDGADIVVKRGTADHGTVARVQEIHVLGLRVQTDEGVIRSGITI